MKVAITGAGNYVGTRLIESFHLGDGPTVAAVARHPSELTTAARFAVDLRVANFFDVDSLARSFAGCRAVVHTMRHAPADMKLTTTILCRAAAQAGARRVVFVSSADVHGPNPPAGTDERSPLHTQHADESINALVLAERQFLADCRQLDLAGYALRAGFLYGPRSALIADLATALLAGGAWLLQQGKGICNGLYVDNLVAAVLLALKAKVGAGSAFLLTDAETVTWRDLYLAAARELNAALNGIQNLDDGPAAGGSTDKGAPAAEERPATESAASPAMSSPATPPPLSPDLIARQQCAWQLPTTRAARELGYRPVVSSAEGMRRSCAWWRFAQGEFFAVT